MKRYICLGCGYESDDDNMDKKPCPYCGEQMIKDETRYCSKCDQLLLAREEDVCDMCKESPMISDSM